MRITARLGLFALCAAVWLCSGCPKAPVGDALTNPRCDGKDLAACERALWAQKDNPAAAAASSDGVSIWDTYLAARRREDPHDTWNRLFQAVRQAAKGATAPRAIIIVDEGGSVRAAAATAAAQAAGVPLIKAAPLATPKALTNDQVLLLLGESAGLSLMVFVEPNGEVRELFPNDPLHPFLAGVPAVVRDDEALAHFSLDLRIAEYVKRAIGHASAFEYLEAAAEADKLVAALDGDTAVSRREPVLRGLYALQLLRSASLVLEKPASSEKTPDAAGVFPIKQTDSPYGDLIRVRLAKTASEEWSRRRENILSAVAPVRRNDIDELFSGKPICQLVRQPPPILGIRDLVFAYSLTAALAADEGNAPSKLPRAKWREQYAALVRLVAESGSAWWYLPALLSERGVQDGQPPAEAPEYERVTALGLRHLEASLKLEKAEPQRYPMGAEWALLFSRGLLSDPELNRSLLTLVEETVRGKLNASSTPAALLEGVWTAGIVGISLPPSLAGAHFRGLFTTLRGLLGGPLKTQQGWTLALLYAIDELYRQLAHEPLTIELTSAEIVRALDGNALPYPELARLTQATVQYLVLGIRDPGALSLEESGTPARFSTLRRDAYDSLRAAILGLRPVSESPPPPAIVEEMASILDALVAVTAASFRGQSAKKPCALPGTVVRSAELRTALTRLRELRGRLLTDPRLQGQKTVWAKRARLLLLVLSDSMDFALRDGEPVPLTVDNVAAERITAEALGDFISPAAATPVGQIYANGRKLLAEVLGSSNSKLGSPVELKQLVSGLFSLLRAMGDSKGSAPLLSALRGVDFANIVGSADETQLFTKVAAQLFSQGKREQADAMLLVASALLGMRKTPLPPSLISLANEQHSPLVALFGLIQANQWPPVSLNEKDARASLHTAAERACLGADTEQALEISTALRRYREGKQGAARKTLASALRKAQQSGLRIPHLEARYQDQANRRILKATVEYTLATMLTRGGSFQLGLGFQSVDTVSSVLEVRVYEPGSPRGEQEAMRAFIQAAARLLIYDVADGDAAAGEEVAGWLVAALRHSLQLGNKGDGGEQALLQDGAGTLMVAAQAAAESGLFSAASVLWSETLTYIDSEATEKTLRDYLQPPPSGLDGVPEIAPLIERTAASLRRAAPFISQCVARPPAAPTPSSSCAAASVAAAMHFADSRIPLLTLSAAEAAKCPLLTAAMDATTASRDSKNAYKISEAAQAMLSAGHAQEAALFLTSSRAFLDCGSRCVALAQKLVRQPLLPYFRIELLRNAISTTGALEPASGPDILTLAEVSTQLPQLGLSTRALEILIARAQKSGDLHELEALTAQPEFLRRWQRIYGPARDEVAFALLVIYLVGAKQGRAVNGAAEETSYKLLCTAYPDEKLPPESLRRGLCSELRRYRSPDPTKSADTKATLHKLTEWLNLLSSGAR